eukprot:9479043-Pyramimonas_sp.AAC.1
MLFEEWLKVIIFTPNSARGDETQVVPHRSGIAPVIGLGQERQTRSSELPDHKLSHQHEGLA